MSAPAGWVKDPNTPDWWYDPNGNIETDPAAWWQAGPEGWVPDPKNPGWWYDPNGDTTRPEAWWHDATVQEPVEDWLTAAEIRQVIYGAPQGNIEDQWPLIVSNMKAAGCYDLATSIAVNATIRVETGAYWPINEYGGTAYFESNYGPQTNVGRQLGNVNAGDGARYHGRGLVQLTGRGNYRKYGDSLGYPLEDEPDLAIDPAVSAAVLVKYFTDHAIPAAAAAGDWRRVRSAVNGGYNGWDTFYATVVALEGIARAKGLI